MFQEKGLNSRQDPARTTLVLKNCISKLGVEVETLVPGCVETAPVVSKKKHFDSLGLFCRDAAYLT